MWQNPDPEQIRGKSLIPIPIPFQTLTLLPDTTRICQHWRSISLPQLSSHPAMASSAISRIGSLMYVIAPLNPCRSIVTSRAPTYTGIEPLGSARPESASPAFREIKFQPRQ